MNLYHLGWDANCLHRLLFIFEFGFSFLGSSFSFFLKARRAYTPSRFAKLPLQLDMTP